MGGLCSKTTTVENASSTSYPRTNGSNNHSSRFASECSALPARAGGNSTLSTIKKQSQETVALPESNNTSTARKNLNANEYMMDLAEDGIPSFSRTLSLNSRPAKCRQSTVSKQVSEVSSILGKAGNAGLGKAVEVLDTLGSSVTSLNSSGGFGSGMTTKGNKVAILAFEVANTVVKGANLMQSLSKENIKYLKSDVFHSEGVRNLISKDIDELLRIAALDKREELKVFAGEVVRFGNRCKDPQWHNLDRYFEKLGSETMPIKKLKDEAETVMQHLMTSVQYTAELYHEMHALDKFEQDYKRKLQEENTSTTAHKGESLSVLRAELKSQRKLVKTLKKKSLWSRILEEVMEKLVDIVYFLRLEIRDAFGNADDSKPSKTSSTRLGCTGLALHYANIITQIDTLVTRSSYVPPSMRDSLYQGLPPNVKSALRSRIHSFQLKAQAQFTVPQIKAEMEKTLEWLVPVAANTTKAHHGFGWVGEWANTGQVSYNQMAETTALLRLETLHHADKEKTEAYILDLVVWLHHLISQTKASSSSALTEDGSPICSPNQTPALEPSPSRKSATTCPSPKNLTVEDHEMLRDVTKRKLTPGISKSQEFDTAKTRQTVCKHHQRLIKSVSHSPCREVKRETICSVAARRRSSSSSVPVANFGVDRIKAMDVIDRVDTLRRL